jgi:hypothetical protein
MKLYTQLVGMITLGLLAQWASAETLFEIEVPNALPPDLQKLPSINLKAPDRNDSISEKTPLSKEVELAVANNDLPTLSKMLASSDTKAQHQAATALGKLTEHQTQARKLLASFIAANTNSLRTEFGEQYFLRQNTTSAAKESLAALPASSSWWIASLGMFVVVFALWILRHLKGRPRQLQYE